MNDDPVKLVALCGSLREGSHSLQALMIAVRAAEAAGAVVEVFDPSERPLPFCYGPADEKLEANRDEWKRMTADADGLILCTPEYHGSCSGVLKNALDLVGFDEMEDKVTGLLSVLGGASNANALNHLRVICRWVHAWVIPHQASVGAAYSAFNPDGTLKDEKLHRRVERVGRDVVKYVRLLRREPELPSGRGRS